MNYRTLVFYLGVASLLYSCHSKTDKEKDAFENISGNEEVAQYIRSFEGRGALSDSSRLTPPEQALKNFHHPDDIEVSLVLSEPQVNQPVNINFDSRGRMWVVQYNQYPYPEGLKIVKIDEHLRSQFDHVPKAPPADVRGADKITFFEDTDNDGKFDRSVDAITGLNIATSVAFGRGKIWVLNPPYLLAYNDADNDGIPEGDPEVHLSGFGIEDTHATANSLTFGPDGWLYGAQGSTTTATINSAVTKNVHFKGQAIWRYHPGKQIFEIFAEGGGNTFHIELDSKGRIYSGDNGIHRGQYYKQGAYYVKNLGKHGLHTNPYAFGNLANMKLVGEEVRFTHGFIRYEGGNLPERYNDRMIAMNPLRNNLQLTRFEKNGSTFTTVDEEKILETKDKWFRPVDIKSGPGGIVYVADWSDSRLSHIDPRDNWHKQSGRIYSLSNKSKPVPPQQFNVATCSTQELIRMLSHTDRWFRQRAVQEFANRKDTSALIPLRPLMKSADGQLALEALWSIHASGGFDEQIKLIALRHHDPYVRMWGVRLTGDEHMCSQQVSDELLRMAKTEDHPEVRSQLAASAKRLPASTGISVIRTLLFRDVDNNDPDIPLQLWWALESKASHSEDVLSMLEDRQLWKSRTLQNTVLERLMKRYFLEGGTQNQNLCARLLDLAPDPKMAAGLINGLQQAVAGRVNLKLSPSIEAALRRYKPQYESTLTDIAIRQGDPAAIQKALAIAGNRSAAKPQRLAYIRALTEIKNAETVPHLLHLLHTENDNEIVRQTISALQSFPDGQIGDSILSIYADRTNAAVKSEYLLYFTSRSSSAKKLIDAVAKEKVPAQAVSAALLAQIRSLNDPEINKQVAGIWDHRRDGTGKNEEISRISTVLRSGAGNGTNGKIIYDNTCGACHKLFGAGGDFGPDLTGYDRKDVATLLVNIVDPSAFVREGYVLHTLRTKDGRTITGMLKSRNAATTSIHPFGGAAVNISNDQIIQLDAMPTSLMPENLLTGISDKEIRDLFAYLMK